jgi:hypothetical protein
LGPRVALTVAQHDGDLHGDGPLLLAAFDRLAIHVDVVPWGPGPDWTSYDGVLIRGTWDYVLDRGRFLAWAATVPRLANPVDVLRWNTDKRYLLDLSVAGVPTVPTTWVEPGDTIPAIEWDDFVVKPSVSAGARLSARYRRGDDVTAHVAAIHETGSVAMLQPYLPSVDSAGETGTYVFGGEVSHAIRKGGILVEGRSASDSLDAGSHQQVGPRPVDPELVGFARHVLSAVPPVLYARVDTVPGPDGEPLLIELEVTEPYLFLEHDPPAADRFAAAVAAWLSSVDRQEFPGGSIG